MNKAEEEMLCPEGISHSLAQVLCLPVSFCSSQRVSRAAINALNHFPGEDKERDLNHFHDASISIKLMQNF